MTTLNTFNSHLNDDRFPYTGDFLFYTVDFMDIYSGQHYFRIIDAGINMTHDERMKHFDADKNCWKGQFVQKHRNDKKQADTLGWLMK